MRSSSYIQQLEEKVNILASALMVSKADNDAAPPNLQLSIVRGGGATSSTPTGSSSGSLVGCEAAHELGVVNRHTHSFEFYGSSSSVAMLLRIRNASASETEAQQDNEEALVSSLHNPAFSPVSADTLTPPTGRDASALSVPVSHHRLFVDSFFATIHYIYPILAKTAFLDDCELIWAGNASRLSRSFIALYYSVLSLGALLRPREEEPIGSIDNVRWSRNFFDEARERSNSGTVTDLEMVQCNFLLARYSLSKAHLNL
jgi:hypothetical protein